MTAALADIINWRALGLVVVLVAAVLLAAWLLQKKGGFARKKADKTLRYRASVLNAASCRGLLGKPTQADALAYTLESAPAGGWYLHFTGHPATGQTLDTLFLLQFEDDAPAVFSLSFVREAFGMREPVIPKALLDEFFKQKLGAQPLGRANGNSP